MSKRQNTIIHRVRDIELESKDISRVYDVLHVIGSGDYGRVILAYHRVAQDMVALKVVPKSTTNIKDFLVEFHYSYFLSPHHNILDTFDVAFECNGTFFFAQEIGPYGDLWNVVERQGGMDEKDLKIVAKQITSALEFMHSKELVHRDVRAENILIFKKDLSHVKLTDFGLTRRAGTLVKKRTRSLPTCPPEIWEAVHLEGYTVELGSDVWQMAMLIFIAFTARFPWEKADITDLKFTEFIQWQKRKTTRTPKHFRRFSPRLLRLFRRMMDQDPENRYPITEVYKYFNDKWMQYKVNKTIPTPKCIDMPHQIPVSMENRLKQVVNKLGQPLTEDEKKQLIHEWTSANNNQVESQG